jgi:hypothetical protein
MEVVGYLDRGFIIVLLNKKCKTKIINWWW